MYIRFFKSIMHHHIEYRHTVFDLISGQLVDSPLNKFFGPPKKIIFFLYVIFFFNFDLISGASTSGHVWPSGLYIVNLYCLHESHLK